MMKKKERRGFLRNDRRRVRCRTLKINNTRKHNSIFSPMLKIRHFSVSLPSSTINLSESKPTNNSLASLITLLKSCKTPFFLQQIHAHIIHKGLEQDPYLVSQFISVSNSLSSSLSYSVSVFGRVTTPTAVIYNSLLHGFSQKTHFNETFSLFVRMRWDDGRLPDKYTFPVVIKACTRESRMNVGKSVHGCTIKYGVNEDVFVATSLVDFYGKCKRIFCARKVFDEMSYRNVVSWTAMLVGYVSVGDLVEAKRLFYKMPKRNVASWNALIGGFVKMGDLVSARKAFDEMPEKNVVSYTTMIDGYAKAGDMVSARFLFDQAPDKDIVAWSALIHGYAQNGQPNEAVKIFLEMDQQNVKPDEFIMVSLMSACSQVGSLDLAKWVDSYLSRSDIDLHQVHVFAALIDMNAKCGNMDRAMMLFEAMPQRDLISYCSIMHGLSIHGCGDQAVRVFDRMLSEGLTPDEVAFTVVLTACSRARLVEEGWRFFELMKNECRIVPSPDHYACMVDLLSRSGQLGTAYELIKSMPVEPNACAWGALLWACKLHGDVELGELVANRLFELEPQNAGNYVNLSNIYAAADRWLDVDILRNKMKERGIQKIPGCSWI